MIVIGSDLEDQQGDAAGAAYVYHRNGTSWPQAHKLLASNGGDADRFGTSVAVNGDAIVSTMK